MVLGEGAPSSLSQGDVTISKLSGNRILAELDISVNGGTAASNFNFPIKIQARDSFSNTILQELVDVNLTITEDLQVTQDDYIFANQSIQLTAAQDQDAGYVEIVTSGLPDFLSYYFNSQTHIDAESRWDIKYRINADAAATVGFHSFDVTYNFRTFNTGQGNQLVHTEVRTITVEVIPRPVAPTVLITSHGDGVTVNTSPVTIEGTVGDPDATVTVNGNAALITVNGTTTTFSADVDLVAGNNPIQVESVGTTGLRSNLEITLNFDSTSAGGGDIVVPVGGSTLGTHEIILTSLSVEVQ